MTKAPKALRERDRFCKRQAQLFARQGYYPRTTREIAGLPRSAKTLFSGIFENKEDLFWAVLSTRIRQEFKFRRAC